MFICRFLFFISLMVIMVLVYRSQMQTIITKACKELSIKPIPSKRVSKWLCFWRSMALDESFALIKMNLMLKFLNEIFKFFVT